MILRRLVFAAGYILVLVLGVAASRLLHESMLGTGTGPVAAGLLAVLFFAFVLCSAIPFIPGAEIGFGILMVLGAEGAVAVYAAMVTALSLSFAAGRFVPVGWLAATLEAVGLHRARNLVTTSMEMAMGDRTHFIEANAPSRWVPLLVRHRYLALAVLLNTPGNVVLGGGGGIAFAAGACRLFSTAGFLVTILIAVAPVPLAFLLFGAGGWFLRS